MNTLKDAQDFVYRDVSGGQCPDSKLVTARINQAVLSLMKEGFSNREFQEWCVSCADSCFLLPPEIETAEALLVDGTPAIGQNQWYKYLCDRTPCPDCECLNFEDLGDGFVTDIKPPYPMSIIALTETPPGSQVEERDDVFVTVQGTSPEGTPAYYHDADEGKSMRGVKLGIEREHPRFSHYSNIAKTVQFTDITAIKKDKTNFPVIISYYEFKSEEQIARGEIPTFIPAVRLMPWETKVCRRKIEIKGASPESVRVLGRARWMPVEDPHDVLIIQDLNAIHERIMMIEAESRGDVKTANYHRNVSERTQDKAWRRHIGHATEKSVSFKRKGGLGGGIRRPGGCRWRGKC